eukprot:TRINITY_DN25933_c0_g1_i1.p1 TRINITY_DN25933_c0_g1~~TRINITY_DN25933_c0_g1_i1.p1  ORF type:complete len:420 (-),score=66.85 TRINITY_DN25933_c0_g1_i1:130-1389(-)
MPSEVRIERLPSGDVTPCAFGVHVVLEAPTGALLHAVRTPDGLCALRGGAVSQFQVARSLPAAAAVQYPAPFGPSPDHQERQQAVERARALMGQSSSQIVAILAEAGGDGAALRADSSGALIAESFASFCVTGVARHWQVTSAYRVKSGGSADRQSTASASQAVARPEVSNPPFASPAAAGPSATPAAPSWQQPSSHPASPSKPVDPSRGYVSAAAEGDARLGSTNANGSTIQHKAVESAAHVVLRGPAAKLAGAAAAIGFEGYNLYNEVGDHSEKLTDQKISEGQYQDRCVESTVTSSGRAMGGLAGAALGQASIPIPVVGAVVGGIVGAAAGGIHANSLWGGAMRLSGGRAKGGDDLVKCVEHKPRGQELTQEQAAQDDSLLTSDPVQTLDSYQQPQSVATKASPYVAADAMDDDLL